MDRSKRLAMAVVMRAVCGGVRGAMPLLGVAAGLAVAAHAGADVKSVPAKYVTVSKDNAALRCADGGHFYAVRMLKAGQTLKVDGEGSGWLRVAYPAGTRAYVGATEGTFDSATKAFKLTRGSKMMAANEAGAAPWWPLLEKDVEAGTVFNDAEAVKAADGTVQGYLVPAPAQARGFVRAEMTRPASAADAAAAGGPVAVKPSTPTAPANPAQSKPADTKVADATKPAEAGKPVDAPATQEIVEVKPTSEPGPIATTVTMTNSRTTTTPLPPAGPNPELTRRVDDLALLRDMFDRAMQHAESEAEVQTVVSEFNRKIDALPTSGDDGRVRVALEQRRDVLVLRQQIIETKRTLSAPDNLDERMRQIRAAIDQVNRQAVYTVVGRILPSTVYDGKRGMASMWRIESADLSSTRTIGYVVPRDGVDLLPKMGKVVGIVGESKLDPALQLNIIAPTRVDELQVVGGKFEVVPGSSIGTPGATPAPTSPSPTPAPAATPPPTPAPGSAATPAAPAGGGQPVASPGTPDTGEPNK